MRTYPSALRRGKKKRRKWSEEKRRGRGGEAGLVSLTEELLPLNRNEGGKELAIENSAPRIGMQRKRMRRKSHQKEGNKHSFLSSFV